MLYVGGEYQFLLHSPKIPIDPLDDWQLSFFSTGKFAASPHPPSSMYWVTGRK